MLAYPTFSFRMVDANIPSIYPILNFMIDAKAESLNRGERLDIDNLKLTVYVVSQAGMQTALPTVDSDNGFYSIFNSVQTVSFKLNLDYFGLSQIEKIRNNVDLHLRMTVSYMSYEQGARQLATSGFDYIVPRSYWVENILSNLKYKEVFLLEIPRINGDVNTSNVITQLTNASNKLSTGDYHGAISSCYQALEATKAFLRDRHLTRTTTENGNTYEEPDFNQFTDYGSIRTALKKSWSGLWNFPQSGARHIGAERGKEEAYFQMLATYGMINLILRYALP